MITITMKESASTSALHAPPSSNDEEGAKFAVLVRKAEVLLKRMNRCRRYRTPAHVLEHVAGYPAAAALRNLLCGIEAHHALLRDLLDVFYEEKQGHLLSEDRELYTILFYVLLLHLEHVCDIDCDSMLQRVLFDPSKISIFLEFFIGNLSSSCPMYTCLLRHLDVSHVQQHLIPPLRRLQEQRRTYLQEILQNRGKEQQSEERTRSEQQTRGRQLTRPKSFRLSAGTRTIDVHTPQHRIETRSSKPSTSPKFLAQRLQRIEDKKQQRAKKIKQEAIRGQKASKQMTFESAQRAERRAVIVVSSDNDEENCRTSDNAKREVREVNPRGVREIRTTTTAILREEALLRAKQRKEVEMLKDFESTRHDARQFDEWRREIKQEEEKQRLLLVEHRRQDYKKHMSDLRKAQLHTLRKKRRDVQLINEQNHDKKCERRQQEVYELHAKQAWVSTVRELKYDKETEDRDVSRIATNREEKNAFAFTRKKMQSQELADKKNLVRSVAAWEATARERRLHRTANFDATLTEQHMLLHEMADAEAQQRLAMNEDHAERELNEKRAEIRIGKLQRVGRLRLKTNAVLAVRERLLQKCDVEPNVMSERRRQSGGFVRCAAPAVSIMSEQQRGGRVLDRCETEPTTSILSEQRRTERDHRLMSKARREHIMESNEEAALRQTRHRQTEALESCAQAVQAKTKDRKAADHHRQLRLDDKLKLYMQVDNKLLQSKTRAKAAALLQTVQRRKIVRQSHTHQRAVRANAEELRPYSAAITAQEQRSARSFAVRLQTNRATLSQQQREKWMEKEQ